MFEVRYGVEPRLKQTRQSRHPKATFVWGMHGLYSFAWRMVSILVVSLMIRLTLQRVRSVDRIGSPPPMKETPPLDTCVSNYSMWGIGRQASWT